ncbi:MAG: hypothetical protein LC754_06415 [Acidobacteria bacterium]|nr:hypothetical protein [Acidobacteriota bacterium]
MKRLTFLFVVAALLLACEQMAQACTCIPEKLVALAQPARGGEESAAAAKKFRDFLFSEFQGAIFTGEVIKIKKVRVKPADDDWPLLEVIVRVEQSWRDAKRKEVFIYTGVGGGDCGVPYVKGQRHFFFAPARKGRLRTDICGPYKLDDKRVIDFIGFLGLDRSYEKALP